MTEIFRRLYKSMIEELQKELDGKPQIISLDLSEAQNCYRLYEETKNEMPSTKGILS